MISTELRAHGFEALARLLDAATTVDAEILALRMALATIDGASHTLRVHARVLRHTSAAHERGRLRGLEAEITVRLGALLRRGVKAEQPKGAWA